MATVFLVIYALKKSVRTLRVAWKFGQTEAGKLLTDPTASITEIRRHSVNMDLFRRAAASERDVQMLVRPSAGHSIRTVAVSNMSTYQSQALGEPFVMSGRGGPGESFITLDVAFKGQRTAVVEKKKVLITAIDCCVAFCLNDAQWGWGPKGGRGGAWNPSGDTRLVCGRSTG